MAAEQEATAEPFLVSAAEAARLCGISRSLFYGLHSSGQIGPLQVRLGGRVLWRAEELRRWTEAGLPSRSKWLPAGEK